MREVENGVSPEAISPMQELGAYEALWMEHGASFRTIAERFRGKPGALPSEFILPEVARTVADEAISTMRAHGISWFGIRVHGAGEYPAKLRDAHHPVEVLYYLGWWDLVETRTVAVVGTRRPSQQGEAGARRLVRQLVEDRFTIVSGLAAGIDTIAHETAIELGGRTIGVIGTALPFVYPPQNRELQGKIASEFLLISQIPVLRYHSQNPRQNRFFFPERNVTMSALTEATIIVEAGETSGTLTQARAALNQGRKLFILDSCFLDPSLTWPQRFLEKGAIRVRDYDDIKRGLGDA